MALQKWLVSAVIATVLGAQICAALPPATALWYWPFVDYPMYADPHFRGEPYELRQLEVYPCATPASAIAVDTAEVGIPWMRFEHALGGVQRRQVEGPNAELDAAVALLTHVLGVAGHGAWCEAELRSRRFVLGAHGFEDPSPPWRSLVRWPLAPAAGAHE